MTEVTGKQHGSEDRATFRPVDVDRPPASIKVRRTSAEIQLSLSSGAIERKKADGCTKGSLSGPASFRTRFILIIPLSLSATLFESRLFHYLA